MRYRVEGKVQGVGFRAHTQVKAQQLQLTGWVKNLPDGRVEVLAYGQPEQLEKLAEWLNMGPPQAHVVKLETEPVAEVALHRDFQIKR